jgi:pimeloyl-ACP methyl ester carboxylesterase
MPRTSAQIARELHTLVQNAGEKPPYVLVGHSFGAANVRVYNGLYPNDVVGMVLADGGYDDLKLPASIQKLSDADLSRRQRDRAWGRFRYRLGISRFLARKEIENASSPLADQEWWYFDIEPKSVEATTSEVENLALFNPRSVQEMKAAGTLGDKPLIVLIAGKGMWGLPLSSQDWVDLQKMWVDGQMQLAQRLSIRGKWIVIPDSTHMIPEERPDAIVSAVREVSTTAQSR